MISVGHKKPYPEIDIAGIDTPSGLCWVSLVTTIAFIPIGRIAVDSPPQNKRHPTGYVKSHPCVALIACPACGAKPGVLCTFGHGRGASPHADRKVAWEIHQKGQPRRLRDR